MNALVSTRRATLRPLVAADRGSIASLTRATGVFREEEVRVALEVLDAALSGDVSYTVLVAEQDRRVAGWICWGATPCTAGTFDMYWLAVDPACHGTGIGTQLVAEMERRLAGAARLIVVETAGREDYASTRAFYEARGYRRAAVIPDFYAPGDDQVVYVKPFTPSADSQEGG
jgi:ribosomal protein S18 acetylase RimI-like enzyme